MPETAIDPQVARELLTLVQDRRSLHKERYPYVIQWYINLNMYAGNQWIQWDPGTSRIVLPPEDPEKPRMTRNKIQPTVRQAVGKVLKGKLRQICPPDTHDEAGADKAKVRTQLLEHLRRVTGTDAKLKDVVTWAALTGSGFARYMWDEDAGPKGDVQISVVSPFSVIVPPNCLTIDQCPWIMEVSTQSVAWVKEHYGVDVDSDANTNAFADFDARVLDFTSAGAFVNRKADTSTTDENGRPIDGGLCTYIMYWERPTASHPNGRLVIVAGGHVVYPTTQKELDEGILCHSPSGDLPYNHLRWFDSGFRFWDMGLVELLVPMQRERNLLISMNADAIKHTARAGWLAPRGSVKKDEWSAEAGAINEYTPVGGAKPEPIAPRAVTVEIPQLIAQIDQDMADISGMHYRPAPGMRAAAAFALQQETDNTLSEPVADNVEGFLIRDGKLKLALARKYYTKGRNIRVTGENMRYEVLEYSRDAIGDSDEVEIQNGGQLAQDKTQRLGQVMQLLGAKDAMGKPVIDAYEARKLLDLENSENIDSQAKADVNRAKYENDHLARAERVEVNKWDNHDIHLREHYTRMKRLDFDELPPDAREAFILHTMAHETAKAAAQAPPGAPPQPGATQGLPPELQGQMPPGIPNPAQAMARDMIPQNPVASGLQTGLANVQSIVAQANQ